MDLVKAAFLGTNPAGDGRELIGVKSIEPDRVADKNFKGPFYTLSHVRDRLKRDTGVLERGLGSVGGVILKTMLDVPHAPQVMYEIEVRSYREIRTQIPFEAPLFFGALWGLVIGWLTCATANYGHAMTEENIWRLMQITIDLECIHAVPE